MVDFHEHIIEAEKQQNNTLDSYKDIKPESAMSLNDSNTFWDNEIDSSTPETIAEDLLSEAFGRSEDEFDFHDALNYDVNEILQKFSDKNWADTPTAERIHNVDSLNKEISKILDLSETPIIYYLDGNENNCGAYNYQDNRIELNRSLLDNPKELVDTVAHELRHAYQHQKADNPVSYSDFLFKVNFDNHITPVRLSDNKYLFFTDYQDQLVEADARAFAKVFSGSEE